MNVVGDFNLVFEETGAEAVDLVATHGIGSVVGPLRLGKREGCEGLDAVACDVGSLGSTSDLEEDKVAMEDGAVAARKDETHDIETVALWRSERDGGDELVGVRFEHDGLKGYDLLVFLLAKVVPSCDGGLKHHDARIAVGHDGEEAGDGKLGACLDILDEGAARRDVVGTVEVTHRHAWDEGIETINLRAAVVAHVSVPFVDDVVVLGVEPTCALGMGTEGVDHLMVVPGDIDVACSAFVTPYVATFAIEHGCATLMMVVDVVPDGAFIGVVAVFVELLFPSGAGEITVPGVEVGDDVVEVAGGVVLDETRRVELLGEMVHLFDPRLRAPVVASEAIGFACGEESPGLVEVDPREDGGVVEVATELTAHTAFPIFTTEGIVVGPPVGRILHDEETETVGPIELARDFGLDVDAVAIEAEVLGDLDLATHVGVGRIGVVALRVVALVEGELEVEWTPVEGDVGIFGAREGIDTDGTLPEIGTDEVGGGTFVQERHFDIVEIGVVEVPEMLIMKGEMETEDFIAALTARWGEGVVGFFTVGEVETDGVALRKWGIDSYFDTDDGVLGEGCEVDVVDVALTTGFDIDGLPYTAYIAVALFA